MDSITHIAIGACMGEALAGKKLGKKAMVWGAAAQSLPDIDVVTALWMDTPDSLLAHRGITHSFLFSVLLIPVLALLANRLHGSGGMPFRRWMAFFAVTVIVHPLLDVFNNYGVGWFEPFSNDRFSLNAVYVADPFFTLAPLLAATALLLMPRAKHRVRVFWWRFGLITATVYLALCAWNKYRIEVALKTALQRQQVTYTRHMSTPAPLQCWLWFVVAGDDRGYNVGYYSLADEGEPVRLRYFPRNDSLLAAVAGKPDIRQLKRFSQDFYTVEKWSDTLVFNDLRFGQIVGWEDPEEHFAFHYFLNHPEDNRTVVQRGRFAKWDLDAAHTLWDRMLGRDSSDIR